MRRVLPFAEEVYRELAVLLAELDSVVGRWPEFTAPLETVSGPTSHKSQVTSYCGLRRAGPGVPAPLKEMPLTLPLTLCPCLSASVPLCPCQAVCEVERGVIAALDAQYQEYLAPLKEMPAHKKFALSLFNPRKHAQLYQIPMQVQ